MKTSISDLVKERVVLLDGAMGTELMKRGLDRGMCPELWNVERPDAVKSVYNDYFEAGSDVILTNSFGGNRIKLDSFGLGDRCHELNYEAARLAVAAKPGGKYVAGSMGPTGKFLKPHGEFDKEDFEKAFASQAKALMMGKADCLLIETMYDLGEALCALRGARSVTRLPVFVTMTFNRHPRGFFTIMGNSVGRCLEELERNGAMGLGANCSLDSSDMANLVKEMRSLTSLPLIAQPNAGQPEIGPTGELVYSQGPEDFVRHVPKMMENGADLIGGCCGTDPHYIRLMAEIIKK